MSKVTVQAKHAIVSDQCRSNWTDAGAVDQALEHLRKEAVRLIELRGHGRGDLLHFKLEIERETQVGGGNG